MWRQQGCIRVSLWSPVVELETLYLCRLYATNSTIKGVTALLWSVQSSRTNVPRSNKSYPLQAQYQNRSPPVVE
nr:hypothetical protein CFP56_63346 [Quercus suber]